MKSLLTLLIVLLSFHSEAFTIDNYLNTLNQNGVEDINEAVSYLPSGIRSNFVLMYKGHGLRGTTSLEPAAILFDFDGTFFVNIGSSKQALGDVIEILQYDNSKTKFELYALKFPLKKDEKGLIVRPTANPSECLKCHNQEPQLLWGNYQKWDGAYGNDTSDQLAKSELSFFKEFKKTSVNQDPYRHLIFDPSRDTSPYPSKEIIDLTQRPNSNLGFLTTRLNAKKLVAKIISSPQFYKKRFAILHELINCKFAEISPVELNKLGITESELITSLDGGFTTYTRGLKGLMAYDIVKNLVEKFNDKSFKKYLQGSGLKDTVVNRASVGLEPASSEEIEQFARLDRLGLYLNVSPDKLCRYVDKNL